MSNTELAWVNIYSSLVSSGKKSIDDVPESLRDAVAAALEGDNIPMAAEP